MPSCYREVLRAMEQKAEAGLTALVRAVLTTLETGEWSRMRRKFPSFSGLKCMRVNWETSHCQHMERLLQLLPFI